MYFVWFRITYQDSKREMRTWYTCILLIQIDLVKLVKLAYCTYVYSSYLMKMLLHGENINHGS